MLDTNFPRILGDAGNPESYSFPARTAIVRGAGSLDIVKDGLPSKALIASFCTAAKKLESQGAIALISTCGFLVSVQDQIAAVVEIPVMVSPLSLYRKIKSQYAGQTIGILTASSISLGNTALHAAGISREDVRIAGMEDCPAFANSILRPKHEKHLELDEEVISIAVVEKALTLLECDSKIAAFILECGNLPPYTKVLVSATGLPVYSILDVAEILFKKHKL